MTARNTAALPVSNDFKDAANAEMALLLLGEKLFKLGRFCENVSRQNLPEALCEAILTQVRNQIEELHTEIDVWRAL